MGHRLNPAQACTRLEVVCLVHQATTSHTPNRTAIQLEVNKY
jgi:hypothetical protein